MVHFLVYGSSFIIACMLGIFVKKIKYDNMLNRDSFSFKLLNNSKWRLYFLVAALSAMPMFFVSAFRYDVGTDYFYTYVPLYEKVVANTAKISFSEPGRWLLMKVIVLLGGSVTWFFVITSALIIFLTFASIYQNSPLPFLSIPLFFLTEGFFASMNGVMQYVALAFVMYGIKYVRKQCFWKYAICVLLGTFFHLSVLIFLPLYLLSKLQGKKAPFIALAIAGVLSVLNPFLIKITTWALSFTKYRTYIGSEFHDPERLYPSRIAVHIAIFAIAFLYYYKNENSNNPLYKYLMYIELITLFLLFNRNLIPLADRVCWGFEMTHMLLIPMIAASEKETKTSIAITSMLTAEWAFLCYVEVFRLGYHEVVPYKFIF